MSRAGGSLRTSAGARLATASLLLALGLSACAQMPKPSPEAVARGPFKPTPGLSVQARIDKAVDLLGAGQEGQARAELKQALKDQPGHAAARSLLGQIEVDPKTLLGDKNFPYTVKAGDTLSGLADRFLGDRLMFYALARYNGMARPEELVVGRVLLIPGVEKKAAPPPPPPVPARKPAAPTPAPPARTAPAPAPAADQARARQLRGTALQKMNSGAIDAAVSLLRQAQQLDPGDALIKRDLERALRIQATLRSRP